MMRAHRIAMLGACLALAACDDGVIEDERQVPPITSTAEIEAWIARGFYRGWQCEPALHDPTPPSPHGRNRTCSNDALSSSTGGGPYPVDAASVKELADSNGNVRGYAISRRIASGSSLGAWFWFERNAAGTLTAAGPGDISPQTACSSGCHVTAPRDSVFVQVP